MISFLMFFVFLKVCVLMLFWTCLPYVSLVSLDDPSFFHVLPFFWNQLGQDCDNLKFWKMKGSIHPAANKWLNCRSGLVQRPSKRQVTIVEVCAIPSNRRHEGFQIGKSNEGGLRLAKLSGLPNLSKMTHWNHESTLNKTWLGHNYDYE